MLVLAGATAAGKTELAVELALVHGAEIVSADSRQVYRGMAIGTAAPTAEQLAAVPHHLIGFLDPSERYSAARFSTDATRIVRDIRARGRRAIVVGGTGFYVRALTGSVDLAPAYDESLRATLAREAAIHDAHFLHAWLAIRDPARAAALDPNDVYRVLRALEIALAPATAASRPGALETLSVHGIPFRKFFLDVPLPELDARIERRTDDMLASGLIEEADRVGADAIAGSAVGYPQALAFLDGWSTHEELRCSLARATRRYARRQRSWFRSEPGIVWADRSGIVCAAREKLCWS